MAHKKTHDEPDGFAAFWARYPHRVGRLVAVKAYVKAIASGVTLAELLAGVDRYIATKPGWQAWAHPSSWLNAGRWLDEVEPQRPELSAEDQRILARRRAGL